jgi:NAD(P)-dependent dehydrogenase (short-subunit alcohol dehydrogenase family)
LTTPAPLRVAGKRALVTGAGSGIGAATARMLARHGARVLITDINGPAAAAVAHSINDEVGADCAIDLQQDVTDPARWDEVVDVAAQRFGGLSVLVNNAGIAVTGSIESLSTDDWHRLFAVNLDSVFYGCKAALRVMRDSQPASIVNISSISGLVASHNFTGYNASKAAVWMLTKSVALHCARERLDIRCNSVHPAFIDTPILDGLAARSATPDAIRQKLAKQIPLGRIGQPDDVAYAVLYLASDESRFVTAAEFKIDGGLSAM